jgi:hypothetical protein
VTDHGASKVFAFGIDGAPIDWVDLSPAIPADPSGARRGSEGRLYIADAV